eukprot:gene14803-20858_t
MSLPRPILPFYSPALPSPAFPSPTLLHSHAKRTLPICGSGDGMMLVQSIFVASAAVAGASLVQGGDAGGSFRDKWMIPTMPMQKKVSLVTNRLSFVFGVNWMVERWVLEQGDRTSSSNSDNSQPSLLDEPAQTDGAPLAGNDASPLSAPSLLEQSTMLHQQVSNQLAEGLVSVFSLNDPSWLDTDPTASSTQSLDDLVEEISLASVSQDLSVQEIWDQRYQLRQMSVLQLRAMAREKNIPGRSKMKKAELVVALEHELGWGLQEALLSQEANR